MMNILQYVFDLVKGLWPWHTIRTFERGVKFRGGIDIALLGPGLHFAWWWWEVIVIVSVVEDVIVLPVQSITTSDGESVCFSCTVAYEIPDARMMYTNVTDFHVSLIEKARGELARQIRVRKRDRLFRCQSAVEKSLAIALSKYTGKWGVKIIDVRLAELVEAPTVRLMGMEGLGSQNFH